MILCFSINFSYSQDLSTIDEWEYFFIKSWDKEYKIAYPKSISGDSWQFYNLAYYIDANIAIYKATKKKKYLERALCYIENMLDSAVITSSLPTSQYKDNYLGWINKSAPKKKYFGKEFPLFESYCWRYVTDLLFVLFTSDELLKTEDYQKRYDRILEFTINNIFNKWYNRSSSNIYRSNVHMSSHWAKISMNLYLITKEEKYQPVFKSFINKINLKFNDNILREKEYILWKSRWDNKSEYMQDVGHANGVVDLIVSIYDNKLGFDTTLINKLIYTFDKRIWKSKTSFSYYVDGTGVGKGWFTDGFVKLGRYNKKLQKRIEKHNRGRSTQFYGNGALNARILLNDESNN